MPGSRNEGFENPLVALADEKFRMPLHAEAEAVAWMLDALDHPVGRQRIGDGAGRHGFDGLMMSRVDRQFVPADDPVQQRAGRDLHRMAGDRKSTRLNSSH